MTYRLYHRGVPTLAGRFQNLIDGGQSHDQAAAKLTAELRSQRLVLDPDLLWPFRLIPTPDDRLTVRLANGRERSADQYLISVDGAQLLFPDPLPAATTAPPLIEAQAILPAPIEDRARDWLAGVLKNDQASGKLKSADVYRKMLCAKPWPGLTTREAERVWKEANETLGDKKLVRGRKKAKK